MKYVRFLDSHWSGGNSLDYYASDTQSGTKGCNKSKVITVRC
jgi:hypothetical protein